jgi:hypothetical protein
MSTNSNSGCCHRLLFHIVLGAVSVWAIVFHPVITALIITRVKVFII